MDSLVVLITSGFIFSIVSFALVFVLALRLKNGGVVDVYWGFSFILLYGLYLDLAYFQSREVSLRAGLFGFMVVIWSLRLGLFLFGRFKRLWPEEDGRYLDYKQAWGKNAKLGLFLAYELQALLLASLSLPFALAVIDTRPPGVLEYFSLALWTLAIGGEALADHQLERFKRLPENKGAVCTVGLWRYSRHPNYFFEWLIWVAYSLFSLNSQWGVFTIYCPLVMYFFLTRVTGVKATEAQALRTKGDAYRKYQENTSAFFPWFKKVS